MRLLPSKKSSRTWSDFLLRSSALPVAIRAKAALEASRRRRTVTAQSAAPLLPKPYDGTPQEVAASSTADFTIYGGHIGAGKSWLLQRQAMRNYEHGASRALLFRRTLEDAKKEGGLWDKSVEFYKPFGARSLSSGTPRHIFPSGARISIAGCEQEDDKRKFDGTELDFIGWDELQQFTAGIFWYVSIMRLRSAAGLRTQVFGTCNPVPPEDPVGGWLSRMLMKGGWVDEDTGFVRPEMSGRMLYFFVGKGDVPEFFETEGAALKAFPKQHDAGRKPLTMMFVEGRTEDNKELLRNDPRYLDKINALPWEERRRVVEGNWKVSSKGGGIINKKWFRQISRDPADAWEAQDLPESAREQRCYLGQVRGWDFSDTHEDNPRAKDKAASVKIGRMREGGRCVIRDTWSGYREGGALTAHVIQTMIEDGAHVTVTIPQDPGSAGKREAQTMRATLLQAAVAVGMAPPVIKIINTGARSRPPGGGKMKKGEGKKNAGKNFCRALAPSQMNAGGEIAIHGNIDIVVGAHTEEYLGVMHQFTSKAGGADDAADATFDSYNTLIEETTRRPMGVY